jgi:serpin B
MRALSLRTLSRGNLAVLLLVFALVGCSSGEPDPSSSPADSTNPLGYVDPIVVRPAAGSPDVPALTEGLNDVGYDLFHYLADGDGDIVLSPLSIGLAFGMLDLGATGTVAQALDDLFGYPVEGDARYSAFNTLEQGVVSEPGPVSNDPEDGYPEVPIVRVGNRMFRDAAFEAYPEYAEGLARWFGAGVEPLQIAGDPEAARLYINGWVDEKTMGLIPELIPQGLINADTVMVLVNTLYLKAQWAEQFDEAATEDADFTLLDGTTVTVPLMHALLDTRAYVGDEFAAVEIPYSYTGDLSMLVILPDEGAYADIESRLGTEFVASADALLDVTPVDLHLPRFESSSDINLRQAFEEGLGVTGLFYVPELLGIGEGIFVTDAVHSATIVVDEEGTEAAAATAIMAGKGAPNMDEIVEIRVDRPFLYLIRDGSTGAVLFVGRVLDPST